MVSDRPIDQAASSRPRRPSFAGQSALRTQPYIWHDPLFAAERRQAEGQDTGAPLSLLIAFVSLTLTTLLYSLLAGENMEGARARAVTVELVNGLVFGLAYRARLRLCRPHPRHRADDRGGRNPDHLVGPADSTKTCQIRQNMPSCGPADGVHHHYGCRNGVRRPWYASANVLDVTSGHESLSLGDGFAAGDRGLDVLSGRCWGPGANRSHGSFAPPQADCALSDRRQVGLIGGYEVILS